MQYRFSQVNSLTILNSQVNSLTMVFEMRWLPTWLAKSYSIIYLRKGSDIFDYDEAKEMLKVEDKKALSDILTRLKNRGFLISRRDPIDPRRRLFKLIDPESALTAFGIQNKAKSRMVLDKLRASHLDYVIGDAYAAYQHHHYSTPGKMDIYVRDKDLNMWIALLVEKSTAVAIDDIPSEKSAKEIIHIHSALTEYALGHSVVIQGVRYLSPENLVVRGLEIQDRFGLADAIAILIVKKEDLDWKHLLNQASQSRLLRELGSCLDTINFESGREVFSKNLIDEIFENADVSNRITFPKQSEKDPFIEEELENYPGISEKWNISILLSKAFISKIVMDLVR